MLYLDSMTRKQLLIAVAIILLGLPALGLLSGQTNFLRGRVTTSFSKVAPEGGELMYETDMVQTEPAIGRAGGIGGNTSNLILPPQPPIYDEGFKPDVDRTVIRTAFLGIVVDDTRQAVDQVKNVADQFGGLITNTNIYEAEYTQGGTNADLTIRVPEADLDAALNQIKQLAVRVTNESISADDRTEQKVDLEAQLRNLRATEEQFLEIMGEASTVQDTLTVQRELNTVRSQIERLQAQVDNIDQAAAMSTIHVSITTQESELPFVDPDQQSIIEEIKTAARDAVRIYRNLFVGGLRLAVIGLPVIVVLAALYFFFGKKK